MPIKTKAALQFSNSSQRDCNSDKLSQNSNAESPGKAGSLSGKSTESGDHRSWQALSQELQNTMVTRSVFEFAKFC